MYRITFCDFLSHGNMLDCHKNRALVNTASDAVAVTTVVDKRQAWIYS